MREISFDTETTGLNPRGGDRLVEIGGVELLNHIPTGNSYHVYINPQRDMPAEAFRVHGLSEEFLSDKPLFAHVADEFLEFVGDATLVIHNAAFDMGFINEELKKAGRRTIPNTQVLDTLEIARRKHPTGPNSLDALCSRYGIDNSRRVKHGALLDAEILAEVYLELIGGRQTALGLMPEEEQAVSSNGATVSGELGKFNAKPRPVPLASRLTDDEYAAHKAFVEGMGESAIWQKYNR
ncbi:DNA polymerase III subunit epsilon [Roseibium album]|uniref:DNA polymerase III subunit epsilon n=1 Tax=Roseibium album TaxID=311410 RepID=A0A0M6ZWK1_9HYPH|nr:DNA polymerase III subunit epsilon [Roseibium album]CTQ58676.1 DNA polymerase III subunit epsilon [Roseibium album]CTQ67149.1 DNA polymerase III subunit epsilon [Roseibium album]CTQ72238.1 DNA polymerase III subunit epsilon [Roseibium album]